MSAGWKEWLVVFVQEHMDDLVVMALGAVLGILRASGVTVNDGQIGLKFSFGRVTRELPPGFHFLFPFLQKARVAFSRSRTLELPAQRVETRERLVLYADANLVYRIVDVRKALIEIDDLEQGLLQRIAIGVQEVLRRATRAELARSGSLDGALAENLAPHLALWGVVVERAGFKNITPDRSTVAITQLRNVLLERRRALEDHASVGSAGQLGLALLGRPSRTTTRGRRLRERARSEARQRRLTKKLARGGWTRVQIKQALVAVRSRRTAAGGLGTPNARVLSPRGAARARVGGTSRGAAS